MAGQDYPEYLEPGQTKNVDVAGDFIYCKFSDRDVEVIVDDQRVKMEAGDNYRPGHRFDSFLVHNPTRNPISIVLTAGKGSYSRQIVQGEIKAQPVLRGEDGTTRPDTRQTMTVSLSPVERGETELSAGDKLDDFETSQTFDNVVIGPNSKLFGFSGGGFSQNLTGLDKDTAEVIDIITINTQSYGVDDLTWSPVAGFVFVDSGLVYRVTRQDPEAPEELKELESGNGVACDLKRDRLGVIDHDQQKITVLDAETLRTINTKSYETGNVSNGFSYDPGNDRYTIAVGESIYHVHPETLELEGEQTTANGPVGPHLKAGRFLYTLVPGDLGNNLEKRAAVDLTLPPTMTHQGRQSEIVAAMTIPERGNKTTANISTGRMVPGLGARDSGFQIDGEVIKAALEYYFAAPVADDYLDHVYGMAMAGESIGFNQKPMYSGSETFARAGITDEGTLYLPDSVTITIDNNLTFKTPLIL